MNGLGSLTTAKVVCCKSCGQVFGTEGWYNLTPFCPTTADGKHQVVYVLVAVPLS